MWINFRIDAPIGDGNITFGEIKRWIQETYRIPARYQHLQFAPDGFNFELLDDNVTVMAYGLDNDDRLYMALEPVATGSGSASNMSVNFDCHGNHVGAQNPPEPQAGAGNANFNNVHNVEDGMFHVHEHLVADLDLNYNPNPDMMIINDPPLMNQHSLNLNAAVDMDDNLNQGMKVNIMNYGPFGVILNSIPNAPLFVASDQNPNPGMMNDPPIMNQQNLNLNAPCWQNWAAEGGIGAAGEAGPSNTSTRSNFKVNIVSEDDALVTVFDVDPSHTVGTLKEHISYIY